MPVSQFAEDSVVKPRSPRFRNCAWLVILSVFLSLGDSALHKVV